MADAGEDIYKRFFHILPSMLATVGFDGRFVELNKAWQEQLGFASSEMTGVPCADFIHPEDQELAAASFKHIREGEIPAPFEARFKASKGGYRWLHLRLAADAERELLYAAATDITTSKLTEQDLRDNEATLRGLIDKSPLPIGIQSLDGKTEYFNAIYTSTYGYTAQDTPDRASWMAACAPDPQYRAELEARFNQAFAAVKDSGRDYMPGLSFKLTCKNGEVRDVSIIGVVSGGKILAVFEDMTARVRTEQALRESEATLRHIIDKAPMSMAIVAMDGTIEYINHKAEETFGYPHSDIPTMDRWWTLAYPDEAYRKQVIARFMGHVAEAIEKNGEVAGEEYVAACKDGSKKTCFIFGVIAGGKVFVMFDDITRRVAAEKSVRDSERTLRSILDQAPLAIVIQAPDNAFEFINHKFTEYFGYTREDVPTLEHWAKLAYPDEKYRKEMVSWQAPQIERSAKTGREMDEIVVKVNCKGGAKKTIRITGIVISGRKTVSLLEDITARVETERALRESESRYRAMIETTGTGYVIINKEGRVMDANREYVRLTGHKDLKEVLGHTILDWTAPYEKEKNAAAVARCAQQGYINNFEVDYAGPDGTIIPVEINATVTQRDGVPHILTLCRDISERRQNTRLLRESEDKFRTVTEKSIVGVYLIQDDKFVYVNPALAKAFGYTIEEITGKKGPEDLTAPRDWPTVKENLRRRFSRETQSLNYEFKSVRKDGSEIDVEVYGSLTDYAGKPAVIGTLLDVTARRLAQEEIAKLNAGLEQRVGERTAELSAANEDLMQEISQRIQAEKDKDKLREELQQAQKMEAVGRLAGGIAHDFNNILVSISGYAEFMLKSLPAGAQGREDLAEILLETEKGASLTRQLLTFSRKQPVQPKVLDLNAVAVDTQKMLKRLIGANMHLESKLEPGLDRIMADPGQISQVIMNLVLNARDAMPEGGRITLETRNTEIGQEYLKMRLVPKPGRYVLLSVSDTGTGMTPETLQHLFEPFYTTKEPGKGTGLGLPTLYGIVSQAHGGIDVESEPGRGATFRIYFPRTLAA